MLSFTAIVLSASQLPHGPYMCVTINQIPSQKVDDLGMRPAYVKPEIVISESRQTRKFKYRFGIFGSRAADSDCRCNSSFALSRSFSASNVLPGMEYLIFIGYD